MKAKQSANCDEKKISEIIEKKWWREKKVQITSKSEQKKQDN